MVNLEGGKVCVQEFIQCGEFFIVVIVYNDLMVVGVIYELVKNGYKVFEQVLVVGFDDLVMCCVCILIIIIIKYLIEEMVEYVVKLVIDLVKDVVMLENKIYLFMLLMIECESVVEIFYS